MRKLDIVGTFGVDYVEQFLIRENEQVVGTVSVGIRGDYAVLMGVRGLTVEVANLLKAEYPKVKKVYFYRVKKGKYTAIKIR